MNEFVRKPETAAAFRAVTVLSVVSAQPDAISSRLDIVATAQSGQKGVVQGATAMVAVAWKGFIAKIKYLIQSISASLWLVISRHLKLKEWSIKGGVSAPAIASFFGITGSAEIQFTFEK